MYLRLVAVSAVLFSLAGVCEAKVTRGQCGEQFKSLYKKGPIHKAFASTGTIKQFSTQGGFACGGTDSWATLKEAITDALSRCERVRRRNRLAGKCRIVASE
jgi:hypothetical protein